MPFHEDLKNATDQVLVPAQLNLALQFLQDGKPLALLLFRNRIAESLCLGVGPGRKLERKNLVVFNFGKQGERLVKILLHFPRKNPR